MKKYIFLLSLINITGCSSFTERRHLRTIKLCEIASKRKCPCNLFLEIFSDYNQGAFGTGLSSKYITDSLAFRAYIGTYDEENEMITIACNGGDSIYVEKKLNGGPRGVWNSVKIEAHAVYSINGLKKQHSCGTNFIVRKQLRIGLLQRFQ